VFDVGKTHTKLTLIDETRSVVAARHRANRGILNAQGICVLDVSGIEEWLAATLRALAAEHAISAIIPVGHGAGAAILQDDRLSCDPLDYEQPIPSAVASAYGALRDPFEQTGSPRLPNGLNLGAQLFWLMSTRPDLFGSSSIIVPWPQYWTWVLSGVAASEATSLGCHTDLWQPVAGTPSKLARRLGFAKHLAPLRYAGEVLGLIRPQWADRAGLGKDTKIYCGLHDSNAALLSARAIPALTDRDFTVISTGTWFLCMRSPSAQILTRCVNLPEQRDCLMNIDVNRKPVPSARFMGGRELEMLTNASPPVDNIECQADQLSSVSHLVRSGTRILPTLVGGVGPFPHAPHRWENEPTDPVQRCAAAALYAALMTDVSLELIGACNRILIEGRFAKSTVFVRALAALRPHDELLVSDGDLDVARGAASLVDSSFFRAPRIRLVEALPVNLDEYRSAWRTESARLEHAA
jgi:sugar (pentulose or hexulose) kinase